MVMNGSRILELKHFRRWAVILLLLLITGGGLCFVIGMYVEQRVRLALPGLCLSMSAASAAGVYGLLVIKKIPVVTSWWKSERQWRGRAEVPVRYWFNVVGWSICSVSLGAYAIAGFAGMLPDQFPRAEWSARTELWGFLVLLSPVVLSCGCWIVALRHLRSEVDYRPGMLILPRHMTPEGLPWMIAGYLLSLTFLVFMALSPVFLKWVESWG